MSLPQRPRAVITGAGGGLGRALCIELARRGARMIVSDVDLDAARATAGLLGGAEAHAVRCDVGVLDEVEALAGQADRLLGGTDLLINNAGVGSGGRVGEVPIEDWEWLLRIDLWGPIYGCHVFVPRLRRQGSGHILNVASAAGLLNGPGMGPYNVAKAGVIALSETLRSELAEDHIGVTVLCPTFFATNILKAGRTPEGDLKKLGQHLMEKSRVTTGDIARAALDGVEDGVLHVVPQADGRWMWRTKRLLPQKFHDFLPRAMKWQLGRVK